MIEWYFMHSKGTIASTLLWDSYPVYNRRSIIFGHFYLKNPIKDLFKYSVDLRVVIEFRSFEQDFAKPSLWTLIDGETSARQFIRSTITRWPLDQKRLLSSGGYRDTAFLYFAHSFLSPSIMANWTYREIRRIWARSEIRIGWICILESII